MHNFLKETQFLDFSHPLFDVFVEKIDTTVSDKEKAIQLYYWVRDGFLYDPHHLDLRRNALKGSTILTKKRAWCVEKGIVLAAAARKLGIPSKLGYAIVINHIGSDRLEKYLLKKEIVFHTRKQVLNLLSSCKILEFAEEERDGETASGHKKHWHIFHFIVENK